MSKLSRDAVTVNNPHYSHCYDRNDVVCHADNGNQKEKASIALAELEKFLPYFELCFLLGVTGVSVCVWNSQLPLGG